MEFDFDYKKNGRLSKELYPLQIGHLVKERFENQHGKTTLQDAFLYFVRRFGNSDIGRDDYKQLATYKLVPKDKDILVYISLSSNDIDLSFQIEKDKYIDIINSEYFKPLEAYYRDFHSFLIEKCESIKSFDETLKFINDSIKVLERFNGVKDDELLASFKKITDFESYINEIPNFMYGLGSLEHRQEDAYKVFNEWIEPREKEFCEATGTKRSSWDDIDKSDIIKEYVNYCYEIMEDFLRPTYIRDVYYNILGEFKGDLNNVETVEYKVA